ncbi:MAG: RNA-guided endonuclease TnpB family protein [Nitrospirota bacterium]|nr:RNA-guided endonuclease TnpB family protein [Nitrospirota bacterium]
MLTAHRIALKPNNKQATYFAKAAGTARFAYNWALSEWQSQYDAWKQDNSKPKPAEASLRRLLNKIKRDRFPWMTEVTKNAPQTAIIQLGVAFKNFFSGRARYPKFRKKGIHERFAITNDQFRIEGSRIKIPKLGWVSMHEPLRFKGKILSAAISRTADSWFVSITVEIEDSPKRRAKNQGTAGVDLGVLALATLSTGEKIAGPKAHRALLGRVRRLSRSLSRKHLAAKASLGLTPKVPIPKGVRLPVSDNAKKVRMRLAKLHARIADIRLDALHKLTTDLTSRFQTVVIENLNVSGMLCNWHLARSIADMSFFEFRRQLTYKAERLGGQVIVADRWFPSSKICSACGSKNDALKLSVRSWTCPSCGTPHDRDVNAAINLRNLAVSSTVSACGEEGSDVGRKAHVKPASTKQEISFVHA